MLFEILIKMLERAVLALIKQDDYRDYFRQSQPRYSRWFSELRAILNQVSLNLFFPLFAEIIYKTKM